MLLRPKVWHDFIKHEKFTLTEQRQKGHWILKLDTIAPNGVNQNLNNVSVSAAGSCFNLMSF